MRELYRRAAAGEPIRAIQRSLNGRGVPSPEGRRWWHSRILAILQSPTYRGRRVHHGQVLDEVAAAWPPLVDEATWWAVQRVLRDPARQAKRPERARHLLSHLARCAVCGGPLQVRAGNARQGQGRVYQCAERFCVAIGEATLDGYVERVLVRWLAGPARALLQPPADDAAAAAARTEVDRLRVELAELYRLVEAGEVGPAVAERAERGLRRRLDAAEVAAHAATVPPALAGVIGQDAAARWARLPLPVKREVVRLVAEVRVRPVGRGRRVEPAERVEWRPLLGRAAGRELVSSAP